MTGEYVRLAALFGTLKGVGLAIVLAAVDIAFLKSLAIAVVSGLIGAAGAVIAARIAVREAVKTREKVIEAKEEIIATVPSEVNSK